MTERRGQPLTVEPRVELAGIEPAVEHRPRQVEAHGVVHDRAAAHAHALSHLEVEVLGQRERAVGVEVGQLVGLVLGEVARVHVGSPLEHEDLAPARGQLVGEHRAGRAGAHDHHVGHELFPRNVRGAHAAHAGAVGLHALHGLLVFRPAREGPVPGLLGPALVAVVAHEAELLRGVDHAPAQGPEPLPHQHVRHLVEEPALHPALAKVHGHDVERRSPHTERPVVEGPEGQADPPLALGAEAREVAVHAPGHLGGGDVAVLAQDEHLGERHQSPERRRSEVAQVVARAHRHPVQPHEEQDHTDVGRHPAGTELGPRVRGADPGVIDALRVAPERRGQHHRRHEEVRDDDQGNRHGGPATQVPEDEQRQPGQQRVLGHRVDHVRILRLLGEPLDEVPDGKADRDEREPRRGRAQTLLPTRECPALAPHHRVHEMTSMRNAVWSATARSNPSPKYIPKCPNG